MNNKKTFNLTLKDGSEVKAVFRYLTTDIPHFEFHGECISETGYRSHFVGVGKLEEDEIESIAIECAEAIRAEYVKELSKKKRREK